MLRAVLIMIEQGKMKLNGSRSQKLDFLAAGESHKATLCFKNFKRSRKGSSDKHTRQALTCNIPHPPTPQPTNRKRNLGRWTGSVAVWVKNGIFGRDRKCIRGTRSAVVGRDRKWSRGTGRGVMELKSWDRTESGVVEPEVQS